MCFNSLHLYKPLLSRPGSHFHWGNRIAFSRIDHLQRRFLLFLCLFSGRLGGELLCFWLCDLFLFGFGTVDGSPAEDAFKGTPNKCCPIDGSRCFLVGFSWWSQTVKHALIIGGSWASWFACGNVFLGLKSCLLGYLQSYKYWDTLSM